MSPLRLYQLAMEFGRCELWMKLTEEQLFAIRFSDGRTGYCSVLQGEEPGMALYIGDEALLGLNTRLNGSGLTEMWQRHRVKMEQRCIELRFKKWAELNPFSRAGVAMGWIPAENEKKIPEIVSCVPFKMAVPLSETQAEDMIFALEAALWLDRRVSQGELGLRAAGFSQEGGLCPMIFRGAKGEWVSRTFPRPDFDALHYPSPRISDEVGVARLRHMKQSRTSSLVCELMVMPEPVQGNPPRYPVGLIIVDTTDGRISAIPVVEDMEAHGESLVAALLSIMQTKGRPARIVARDRRVLDLLSTALGQVGCPLERAHEVRGMDQICQELYIQVLRQAQARLQNQAEHLADEEETPAIRLQDFSDKKAGECRCELCRGVYTKGGLPNHFRGCRKTKIPGTSSCLLLRAEDVRFKQYYFYFAADVQTRLSTVETFMRKVWGGEGQPSGRFVINRGEGVDAERPLHQIVSPGDSLTYEFGGAKIQIRVFERFEAEALGEVKLVARNVEPHYPCAQCDERARFVSEQGELLCAQCAEKQDGKLKKLNNTPFDARFGDHAKD